MAKRAEIDAEREEAQKNLLKLVKPGQTVYCILRSASASGMSRVIDLVIAQPDVEEIYPRLPDDQAEYKDQRDYNAKPKRKLRGYKIRSIGYLAAQLGVDRWDRDQQGIRVSGSGMDMGFELVYRLGCYLWPKGTPKPHSHRNGEPDRSGGYALKHSWL